MVSENTNAEVVCAGIDIGSTATKVVAIEAAGTGTTAHAHIAEKFVVPTGWSSKVVSGEVYERLQALAAGRPLLVVATGYGRVAVDYADRVVTEITCHALGGSALLFGLDPIELPGATNTGAPVPATSAMLPACTIIDVGGQDTKVVTAEAGRSLSFLMNDKCSAGTGKFLEVMANRLGVDMSELFELASTGTPCEISSMCTVFAESEIISHIGAGRERSDIAAGIVASVCKKVAGLVQRHGSSGALMLTGGLCEGTYFVQSLSQAMEKPITTCKDARYAGALGAALLALQHHRKPRRAHRRA